MPKRRRRPIRCSQRVQVFWQKCIGLQHGHCTEPFQSQRRALRVARTPSLQQASDARIRGFVRSSMRESGVPRRRRRPQPGRAPPAHERSRSKQHIQAPRQENTIRLQTTPISRWAQTDPEGRFPVLDNALGGAAVAASGLARGTRRSQPWPTAVPSDIRNRSRAPRPSPTRINQRGDGHGPLLPTRCGGRCQHSCQKNTDIMP